MESNSSLGPRMNEITPEVSGFNSEIESKLKELEIRMEGLKMMINTVYDLALQFATFNKD